MTGRDKDDGRPAQEQHRAGTDGRYGHEQERGVDDGRPEKERNPARDNPRFTGPPWSSSAGEAWIRVPFGMEQKHSRRRRHPILFGILALLLLGTAFIGGRLLSAHSLFGGPVVAVAEVTGLIVDSEKTVAFLDSLREDDAVRGVLVRINSPGGAVGPSQEIFAAVKRLAQSKPVVASLGATAASGGYYIALGAREIVSGPSTLTGSIGVKMQLPNIEGLMRTLGVSEKTLRTGNLKDAGNIARPMTPEEEAYLDGLLADLHEEFVRTVATERRLSPEAARNIADGRAVTGRRALELGLVDAVGDAADALTRLQTRCGLENGTYKLVRGPENDEGWIERLFGAALDRAVNARVNAAQPLFSYR
ncbi:MAG: signal peptide peptidase SppA [Desulfovibrio sp.]|jgi:protease-4|nr:signal peptide peptidase SppA [Desulfovibrio sp.]